MTQIDKVVEFIHNEYVVVSESDREIQFNYDNLRGSTKYTFDKNTLKVSRIDEGELSSQQYLSVEVHTSIYSILDDTIKPIKAQEVFERRKDQDILDLLKEYGG